MIKYLAKVKETTDIVPHAKQYKAFFVTCPSCGYECAVEAVDELFLSDIYPKCHVCGKKLVELGEDEKKIKKAKSKFFGLFK
jgi:transcription elongation factor Elf1